MAVMCEILAPGSVIAKERDGTSQGLACAACDSCPVTHAQKYTKTYAIYMKSLPPGEGRRRTARASRWLAFRSSRRGNLVSVRLTV